MALRALLVIADISGYTRFMTVHRVNLAHAQDVVAQLLESVIDSAHPAWKLAKLEGDAALFYTKLGADEGETVRKLPQRVSAVRRAFVDRRHEIQRTRMCNCDGCTQAGELRIKFVAHVGDVALQKVKSFTELAGLDVILVHRMLKNGVPAVEYALMTEAVTQHVDEDLRARAEPITESLEGVGDVKMHYVDLEKEPVSIELAPASWLKRLWTLVKLNLRSIPYVLGFRRACDGFRNMDTALGATHALPSASEAEPKSLA